MTHAQVLLHNFVAQQKSRNKSLVCHQPNPEQGKASKAKQSN